MATFALSAVFFVCWKPASFTKAEAITVCFGGKTVELFPADKDFEKIEKAVKKAIRSSCFSIVQANGKLKTPTTEQTAEDWKDCGDWIEISVRRGKYKKILLPLSSVDKRALTVFATQTDSYDDGRFLFYINCNFTSLIAALNSL